jgi:hypothetical protein
MLPFSSKDLASAREHLKLLYPGDSQQIRHVLDSLKTSPILLDSIDCYFKYPPQVYLVKRASSVDISHSLTRFFEPGVFFVFMDNTEEFLREAAKVPKEYYFPFFPPVFTLGQLKRVFPLAEETTLKELWLYCGGDYLKLQKILLKFDIKENNLEELWRTLDEEDYLMAPRLYLNSEEMNQLSLAMELVFTSKPVENEPVDFGNGKKLWLFDWLIQMNFTLTPFQPCSTEYNCHKNVDERTFSTPLKGKSSKELTNSIRKTLEEPMYVSCPLPMIMQFFKSKGITLTNALLQFYKEIFDNRNDNTMAAMTLEKITALTILQSNMKTLFVEASELHEYDFNHIEVINMPSCSKDAHNTTQYKMNCKQILPFVNNQMKYRKTATIFMPSSYRSKSSDLILCLFKRDSKRILENMITIFVSIKYGEQKTGFTTISKESLKAFGQNIPKEEKYQIWNISCFYAQKVRVDNKPFEIINPTQLSLPEDFPATIIAFTVEGFFGPVIGSMIHQGIEKAKGKTNADRFKRELEVPTSPVKGFRVGEMVIRHAAPDWEMEYKKLKEKSDKKDAESDKLKKAKEKIKSLKESNARNQAENARNQEKIESLKESNARNQEKIENLKEAKARNQERIESLKESKARNQAENARNQEKIESLKESNARNQAENAKNQEKIESLKEAKAKKRKKIKSLKEAKAKDQEKIESLEKLYGLIPNEASSQSQRQLSSLAIGLQVSN